MTLTRLCSLKEQYLPPADRPSWQHSWPFAIIAQAFLQFGQSFSKNPPQASINNTNSQFPVHLLLLFAVKNSVFELKVHSTVIH